MKRHAEFCSLLNGEGKKAEPPCKAIGALGQSFGLTNAIDGVTIRKQ